MRNKLHKNIYLVNDLVVRCNSMPNCLNHERTEIIFDNGGCIDNSIVDHYFENYIQIPNMHGAFNMDTRLFTQITVYEYFKKYKNTEDVFLYAVEPYANISHVMGSPHSYDKVFCLEFSSKLALQELQDPTNNFYFALAFPSEGTIQDDTFKLIHEALKKYKIPSHKFIFTIASADIELHYEKFCMENNIDISNQIKVLYWTWSIRQKVKEAADIEKNKKLSNIDGTNSSIVTENDIDLTRKRPYKFMIFNRRMRVHRILLLSLLGKDFIDQNLVSYDFAQTDDTAQLPFFNGRVNSDYIQHSMRNMQELLDDKPLSFIDFENVSSTMGFGCEHKIPYLDSYIHVITETNFDEAGVYFSEKTWKPIIGLQPFIMVNYHNALKYLKELGFKTFHPFIDESYDSIEDPKDRIVKIYKEIDRINNLSIDEIHSWYESIYEILVFNRILLMKHQEDYMYNKEVKFLTKIINYVESN